MDEARADRIEHARERDRQGAGDMLQCRHARVSAGQDNVGCQRRGQQLLTQKYGLPKIVGDFFSRLMRHKQTVIAVEFD